MIGIDIAIGLVSVAVLAAGYRMVVGPADADRAIAADMLFFALIGLVALFGVRFASTGTFDLVLIATLIGLLAGLSLARLLTGARR